MTRTLRAADITVLCQLSGLRFPAEDLAPLAQALARHVAFVEPLLRVAFEDASPSLTHDPRWAD